MHATASSVRAGVGAVEALQHSMNEQPKVLGDSTKMNSEAANSWHHQVSQVWHSAC